MRKFSKGDKVYLRKSGMNTQLTESWAGPYTILKKNSPLSYRVSAGDRTLQSVHVQQLKLHTTRESNQDVRRVTTVLEPDSANDTMDNQYIEVTLTGRAQTESREADIKGWEKEFHDTLTKDLGTTELAKFKIDTGDHPPIS